MHTLDVWRLNRELPNWERDFPRPLVDLSRVDAVDPYAVVFLLLYARRCAEAEGGYGCYCPGGRKQLWPWPRRACSAGPGRRYGRTGPHRRPGRRVPSRLCG